MAVEAKNCEKFMSGHCPLKNGRKGECKFNHEVETCSWGKHCPDILTSCLLRHPEVCQKFLEGKCLHPRVYKHCSFLHPKNLIKQTNEDDDRFRGLREEIEKTNLSIAGIQEQIENLTKEENHIVGTLQCGNCDNLKSRVDTLEVEVRSEVSDKIAKLKRENEELTKQVEILKTSKNDIEKEVKKVRRGIDNWKTESKKMWEQAENGVDKKINDKLEAMVKARKDLNGDVKTITQSIKEEIFEMDNLGRKKVIDEISQATNTIIEHVKDDLGVDIIEGVTLKDTIIEIMKEELSTDNIKEKLGIENLIEEVEHLDGIVNNKIEVAVSKVKDDLTEEFKNQIKGESAGTEKMRDIERSISNLKNDVTGLQTNVSNNRTSFSNLKQNLEEMKARDLETKVNELNTEMTTIGTNFSNLKSEVSNLKDDDIWNLQEEMYNLKLEWMCVQRD